MGKTAVSCVYICFLAALEVILEGMMDLLNEKSKQAIEAQKKVIEATKSHTQLLKTAMDDSSDVSTVDNL